MNHQPSAGLVVRKIALFTVLGFITILLFGPVVAVLSVLISLAATLAPFVLVGFLVWTGLQLALHGREETESRLRHFRQGLLQAFPKFGEKLLAAVRFPFRTLGRMVGAIVYALQTASQKLWALVRWLGPIAGMAVTGVAVGAGIGAAVGAPTTHDPNSAIAINAVLGGLMAASAGVVLSIAERRQTVRASSSLG